MRVIFALSSLGLFVLFSPSPLKAASSWQLRAGVGYDYLSQEFYQELPVHDQADSIFANFLLHNEYLNDFKGIASLRYSPLKKGFSGTLTYEQTKSQFRLSSSPNFRFQIRKTRIWISNDLEWRGVSSDDEDLGSNEYLLGTSRLFIKTSLSEKVDYLLQGNFDGVNFTADSTTGIDYYRFIVRSGVSWHPSDMTSLEARLFAATRRVPDSSLLEYHSFGADVSLFSLTDQNSLDLYWSMEQKEYQVEGDDLTHLELSGRCRHNLSELLFGAVEADGQLDLFKQVDPINNNVGQLRTALLGGWTNDGWTLAVGPESEFLNEAGNAEGVEDYLEIGGRIDLERISGDVLFLSATSSVGRRNVIYEDDILSDFTYGRFNLFGDWRLTRSLHLNGMISIDREWNRISTNSATTYITSSSLLYEF